MPPPSISIVVATFNGSRFIKEAVESAVAGNGRDLAELIVVDDGSTDGTGSILEGYGLPVRYVRRPHLGQGAARNYGISLAGGNLLGFLDADDRIVAGGLAVLKTAFLEDPALEVAFGHVHEFLSSGLDGPARSNLRRPRNCFPGRMANTMLIRREAFERVGGFSCGLKAGLALDWAARAAETQLKTTMLPDVIWERRLHSDNLTSREWDSGRELPRVLKQVLDRRRASAPGA